MNAIHIKCGNAARGAARSSVLDIAGGNQGFDRRIGGELLGAIDLVEGVVLAAEIAVDGQLAQLVERAVDFGAAKEKNIDPS